MVYRMFNLTTQSIRISRDISLMNVNYGKWKYRVKNVRDSSSRKEKFINNDNEYYNIHQNINTPVNHPIYNREDIITEPENKLEVKNNINRNLYLRIKDFMV